MACVGARLSQLFTAPAPCCASYCAELRGTPNIFNILLMAGELGFEPRQTESESVVLPLHHSPIIPLKIKSLAGPDGISPKSPSGGRSSPLQALHASLSWANGAVTPVRRRAT